MSLVVDVLKTAQRERFAKGAPPQFINYPHEEGASFNVFFSKNVWIFGTAIVLTMVLIFAVLGMRPQQKEPVPGVKMESITPAPETSFPEDKSRAVEKEETGAVAKEDKMIASQKVRKNEPKQRGVSSGKVFRGSRSSEDIRHHFALAVSYQKQGQSTKAMEEYTKVIEIDSMNVEAHNNLGVIYKDIGRLDQAAEEFRIVLSMDPHQEKARNNLGVISYLKGDLGKAVQEFMEVLDVNPDNEEAYINLGVIYKKQNRLGKAKSMFENAVSINPYSPEAYYNLALMSEENGEIQEAVSFYKRFIDFAGSSYHDLTAKVKRHVEALRF